MDSLQRYKERKLKLARLSASSELVVANTNQDIINEMLASEVDIELIAQTTHIVEKHYTIVGNIDTSVEDAKEFLNKFKKDFNQARFDKLVNDCKKDVINSIAVPFGLGHIVAAYDKVGGNVTTLNNFEKGIVATDGDKERHDEWQRIVSPSESDYKLKEKKNGKVEKIPPQLSRTGKRTMTP